MTINMEITKEQYKTLLKLMYCGEWVLNSYKTGEDKVSQETDKFEQFIFSYAKEFKLEKWIEYDDQLKKYFPTQEMETALHRYIDTYNARHGKL
jgi:hypothetical protein